MFEGLYPRNTAFSGGKCPKGHGFCIRRDAAFNPPFSFLLEKTTPAGVCRRQPPEGRLLAGDKRAVDGPKEKRFCGLRGHKAPEDLIRGGRIRR